MKRLMVFALGLGLLSVAQLSAAPPRKEDAPKLIEALKSADAQERAAAAQALGELGQVLATPVKPAVPTFIKLMKSDKDAKVRRACAEALGKVASDPDKSVPALIEVVKNDKEEREVRTAAILALAGFSDNAREAIPVLREIAKELREKDRQLAQTAAKTAKFLQTGM